MIAAISTNYRVIPSTEVLINALQQVLNGIAGDSTGNGTCSIQPWNSGFVQHPIPDSNTVFEFNKTSGTVVQISASGQADTEGANDQSQWPAHGIHFYQLLELKSVVLEGATGGDEVFPNGDNNNWYSTGTRRAEMETQYALAKTAVAIDKFYRLYVILGINDYNAAQTLSNIKLGWESFAQWINETFDTPEVYIVNIGNVNKNVTTRILTGRSDIINLCEDYSNFYECATLENYWDRNFYGTRDPVTGLVAPNDGIHLRQEGNNQLGQDIAEYEVRPRFAKSFRESDAVVNNLSNTTATLNIAITVSGTIYWSVYPASEAVHSKADIQNGVNAVSFGTLSGTSQQQIVNLSGLTNNTWYRVHHWAVSRGYESDVYRTDRFYTRNPGSIHPTTQAVLNKYSAPRTSDFTNCIEGLLNIDAYDYIDYMYVPRVATADRFVTMKGSIVPVALGTPTFTDMVGWDFAPTGDNRINLQITHSDLPNYAPDDCFYAFSVYRNDDLGATTRFMFGANESGFRSSRVGQTNGIVTYCISENGGGNDYSYEVNHLQTNKIYLVGKRQIRPNANAYDSQYTLNSEIWISGQCKQVTVSALETDETVAPFYLGCQNNRTGVNNISGRFDGVPGPVILGGGMNDINPKKVSQYLAYLM